MIKLCTPKLVEMSNFDHGMAQQRASGSTNMQKYVYLISDSNISLCLYFMQGFLCNARLRIMQTCHLKGRSVNNYQQTVFAMARSIVRFILSCVHFHHHFRCNMVPNVDMHTTSSCLDW